MKLKNQFEIMELDDQFVAVPVGTNSSLFQGVLKMNSSAKEIIELLINETTEDAICSSLNQRYPGQEQSLANYVHSVLSTLRENNLLEE